MHAYHVHVHVHVRACSLIDFSVCDQNVFILIVVSSGEEKCNMASDNCAAGLSSVSSRCLDLVRIMERMMAEIVRLRKHCTCGGTSMQLSIYIDVGLCVSVKISVTILYRHVPSTYVLHHDP